jgi:sodium/hydrogen antiporter
VIGVAYLLCGLFVLAVVWLPLLLRGSILTLPIFAVVCGVALFWAGGWNSPLEEGSRYLPELTRAVLIFAVMEAGLKIDRSFSFRGWASTWRLLFIVMPLNIFGAALLAALLLPSSWGMGVLIGAILAPTDPVLASSVGLGPPGRGEEGEVRFALTSEAGLNDGLAFPFLILGLTMLETPDFDGLDFGRWFLIELLARVAAGAAIGAACGLGLIFLNRKLPPRWRLAQSCEGLAVVGIMFFVYGCAEWATANGLVAVFAAGASIRRTTQLLDYTKVTYAFAEQLERLLMTVILLLFGGTLLNASLPALLSPQFLFVLLALFAVRPVAVFIGFLGSRTTRTERVALGYFGIRGIGTLFYLFYALAHGATNNAAFAPVISLLVLMSVGVFGVSGVAVMGSLEKAAEGSSQAEV